MTIMNSLLPHANNMNTRGLMVEAVLSPPTVTVIPLLQVTRRRRKTDEGTCDKTCRLCGCSKVLEAEQSLRVAGTLRMMMSQVGLDLDLEETPTFCSICLSQLESLVGLKRRMDRLGERLATMIIGLHTLFCMDLHPTGQEEEEGVAKVEVGDDDFDVSSYELESFESDAYGIEERPNCPTPEVPIRNDVSGANSNEGLKETKTYEVLAPQKAPDGASPRRVYVTRRRHLMNVPFQCHLCGKVVGGRSVYLRHLKVLHKGELIPTNPIPAKPFPEAEMTKALTPMVASGKVGYTCQTCGKLFVDAMAFRQHMRGVHWKEDACSCGVCGKAFQSRMGLWFHSQSCPTLLDSNKCYFCEKSLPSIDQYRNHLRVHTLEVQGRRTRPNRWRKFRSNGNRFQCPTCGKGFTDGSNFKRHVVIHTGEKPHACPVCSWRFAEKAKLKLHLRTHLPEAERSFVSCSICHRRLTSKSSLRTHVQRAHTPGGAERFGCPSCSKTFCDKASLQHHLFTHKPGEERPSFVCQVCHRGFTSRRGLVRHRLLHNRGKLFRETHTCPICKRNYPNLQVFQAHAHPDGSDPTLIEYTCTVCGKLFKDSSTFLKHITQVHSKEEGSCQCDACGKVYRNQHRLDFHRKHFCTAAAESRDRVKPSCYFCQKELSCSEVLGRHLRTHTLERPYPCVKCGREFALRGNLTKHMRVSCASKRKKEQLG